MDNRDFDRIARTADLVVLHARGLAYRSLSEDMRAHEIAGVDRSLKNLAKAAGYRLVPANDRETEDA